MDSFYVRNVLNEGGKMFNPKYKELGEWREMFQTKKKKIQINVSIETKKKVFWVGDKLRYYKKE